MRRTRSKTEVDESSGRFNARYNFYGCPADCLLFKDDDQKAKWFQGGGSGSTEETRTKRKLSVRERVAWISGAFIVVGALVTGVFSLLKREEPNVNAPLIQQAPQQQAPGATSNQQSQSPGCIQAGRDVIFNAPSTQPAQRSRILYERMKWVGTPSDPPCELIVYLKNFGPDTGTLVNGGAVTSVGPSDPKLSPPDPAINEPPGIVILGPGQETQYKMTCGEISTAERDAIRSGRARFYVSGLTTYSDSQAKERRMKWCVYWNHKRNGYSHCEAPGSNVSD